MPTGIYKRVKPPWNKGKKMPPEYGEARGHSFRGRHHTRETKRKISEANRNHLVTTEMRQKMSIAQTGRLGENGGNWRGGKNFINSYGYVMEFDKSLAPRKGGRRTPRYRRVMEEKIGRKLLKGEMPHHINGIKDDDRPENLYLCNLSSHRKMHNEMSRLVMELYREGKVRFEDGRYSLCQ